MKKIISATVSILLAAGGILLGGCSIPKTESATIYDLGPLRTRQASALSSTPPISVAEIHVPAWLDGTMIFFRLNYANDQQPRPYAHARWTMTPAQLLLQHLKSRIAQAGGVPLPASDGALNVPLLRIEADDFIQSFDSPAQSAAQIGLRASVYRGRTLVAQKSFVRQAPAPSADAAGGAKALAIASDAAISDVIEWLAQLNLK